MVLEPEQTFKLSRLAVQAIRGEPTPAEDVLWLVELSELLGEEYKEGGEDDVSPGDRAAEEADARAILAEEKLAAAEAEIAKLRHLLCDREYRCQNLQAEIAKLKSFRPERLMFLRRALEAGVSEIYKLESGEEEASPKRKRGKR